RHGLCRAQGLRRQPHRRLRVPHRHLRPLRRHGARRFRGHARDPAPLRRGDVGRRAALPRRDRQERAASALHLAARRDGGPHAGLGAHPRGDHGHGRRVHDRPPLLPLRAGARDPGARRHRRLPHGLLGGDHRDGAERHQEGARLFHRLPARLHVHRRRGRRLLRRDRAPHHARLLQGLPLPRIGSGDPRPPRRAGHRQDGRAAQVHAAYSDHLRHRHGRHHRRRPHVRFLLQGRDPLAGAQYQRFQVPHPHAGSGRTAPRFPRSPHLPLVVTLGIAIVVAWAGAALAWTLYKPSRNLAGDVAFERALPRLRRALVNKLYVDEIYDVVFVRTLWRTAKVMWRVVDSAVIDGLLVNGSAQLVAAIGALARRFQNGNVQRYAAVTALGVAALVYLLLVRT